MASSIVIFGASGDLTSRKLIPALYRLSQRRRIDPETRIVGVSRTPLDDAAWRKQLAESTAKYVGTSFDAESWSAFSQKIFYVHVPLAIVTLIGFVFGGICAVQYLRTGDSRHDLRSYTAIHQALIFCLGALITG